MPATELGHIISILEGEMEFVEVDTSQDDEYIAVNRIFSGILYHDQFLYTCL